MFFLVAREDVVALEPKYFGKNVAKHIFKALRQKVEGKVSGRYGCTIAVAELFEISLGHLHVDTGHCHFNVKYNAIVLRTFPNEILPCIVASFVVGGFWANAGPIDIFVPATNMPTDMKLIQGSNGMDIYYSELEEMKIEVGNTVRVKVLGQKRDVNKISIIGSIAEDYLVM